MEKVKHTKNAYVVFRLDGSFKQVDRVFTGRLKAIEYLKILMQELIENDIEVWSEENSPYKVEGIRWMGTNHTQCSAYIGIEKLN